MTSPAPDSTSPQVNPPQTAAGAGVEPGAREDDRSFIASFARRPGAPAVDFRVGMTCATAGPRSPVYDGAGYHVGWSDGAPAMVEEITRETERQS